jgi:phage tail sheath protein FI
MAAYKTPGVFVEEISTIPPSVAEVSTAIPAFLGYSPAGKKVARVTTQLEFEQTFGKTPTTNFAIETQIDSKSKSEVITKVGPKGGSAHPAFLLHYAVSHYFKNGGGPCYIVSVGNVTNTPSKQDFLDGLATLAQEDEPTLIVPIDAVRLNASDYFEVCQQALAQCNLLMDRFLIADVPGGDVSGFRNGIGTNYLSYAAAYHPYLETSLNFAYEEAGVMVTRKGRAGWSGKSPNDGKGISVSYAGPPTPAPVVTVAAGTDKIAFSVVVSGTGPTLTITNAAQKTGKEIADAWKTWAARNSPQGFAIAIATNEKGEATVPAGAVSMTKSPSSGPWTALAPADGKGISASYTGEALAPKIVIEAGQNGQPVTFSISDSVSTLTISNAAQKTGKVVADAWATWVRRDPSAAKGFALIVDGDGSSAVSAGNVTLTQSEATTDTMASLKTGDTALYNQIKEAMTRQRVTLPPSPAIAGLYAQTDRDRGVWKAPANVSIAAVVAPTAKITDQAQEDLNVDPTAGKSINAIRAFNGKGTLVWGARTLAGNDNEWRYVPVRRLFITIEESTRKASAFAVFEPNDATTWLKVKGMIDSYLYGLWERGALAGSAPEDSYYVNVGLGKTMTQQDVLEGRLIVEIGVAAVRPAEFVVLRFMHKTQVA